MKKPDVSIVMSVYNGAEYLSESIESILLQEGVDFEIIIVNDGSTDESGKILEEYADRDRRLRILHHENRGLTKALIKGCSEAKGQYIARHDVGDVSLPARLMLQKKAFDTDSGLSFVSCWTEFCGPDWEFLYMSKGSGYATTPCNIISETKTQGVLDGPSCHPSVMFRKDAYTKVGGYRAEFYYGQDWELWYRLAEIGKFQMINQPLYKARVMPNSISGSRKREQDLMAAYSLEALRRRQKGLAEEDILQKASMIRPQKDKTAQLYNPAPWLYFIGECLRRNGNKRAISYFQKSIRANPFFIKSWVRIIQALILLR